MTGFIQLLTGARGKEQGKTLMCFLALFMLLLSYYLIKPARQSTFLSEFDADKMPLMYLIIPTLSFSVARVFNFFYERIDRYRLIFLTYLLIIGSKVAFTFILPYGGKPGAIMFFLWGSVYFLLALPTMWACINDIFTSEQGERCFGFVAMGATTGGIGGSVALSWIIGHGGNLKDYALLLSAGAMGISLALILTAARAEMRRRAVEGDDGARAARKVKGLGRAASRPSTGGLFGDVRDLWSVPYVRSIAVMVVCMALYNSTTTFLSQIMIEQRMSETQYRESYAELNRQLNLKANLPADNINDKGRLFITHLKSVPDAERKAQIDAFLSEQNMGPEMSAPTLATYPAYRKAFEARVRKFMADVNIYQGIMGICLLAGASRFLFRRLSLRVSICILPLFAMASTIAWGTPIGLGPVAVILIVGGSLNYSLNNATKELLYTMTSQETKFKYKPLIDGPGQRLGALSAAILNLILVSSLGLRSLMGYPEPVGVWALLVIVLAGVLYWFKSVFFVGGEYDRLRREQKADDAADDAADAAAAAAQAEAASASAEAAGEAKSEPA